LARPAAPRQALVLLDARSFHAYFPGNIKALSQEVPMLSTIPVDFSKINKEDLNKEILRIAIIAELDAINLYEQLAALSDNKDIQAVFLDIAKEEKTHVGEFHTMLLKMDAEQVKELAHGQKEVAELTGK
jgi:rubrerythrin